MAPPRVWMSGDSLKSPDAWTSDRWVADDGRLAADLSRAIEAVHWAPIRVVMRPAVLGMADTAMDDDVRAGAMVWHADALMPDGREVRIMAWPAQPRQVAVAVRVGRFGDAAQERQFIDALRKVLDGPSKRIRRNKFVLPGAGEGER